MSDRLVTIVSTDSPDKRPDVTTDAGKAVVVRYLDQLNDVLVDAIARGRGVSARQVREGYGRGASFTAARALELGMLDAIRGVATVQCTAGATGMPTSGAPVPRSVWTMEDMDAATRLALAAGEAIDQRKAAERRARTEAPPGPAAATAPRDPTRPWVMP